MKFHLAVSGVLTFGLSAVLTSVATDEGPDGGRPIVPVPATGTDGGGSLIPTAVPVPSSEPVSPPKPLLKAEIVPDPGLVAPTRMDPVEEPLPDSERLVDPKSALEAERKLVVSEETAAALARQGGLGKAASAEEKEAFLQDHREQLEIYDLNNDNKISKEEWKAANKDDAARAEKFFLVDKDEDGEIDENEAVGFLLERFSLSSTFIDSTGADDTNPKDDEIEDAAPTELRFTLFSIPLGEGSEKSSRGSRD